MNRHFEISCQLCALLALESCAGRAQILCFSVFLCNFKLFDPKGFNKVCVTSSGSQDLSTALVMPT